VKTKKICVLSIAGSDSGAGAGIQSDLKTFHKHGLYGLTVITAVTSQNTLGVQSVYKLPARVIRTQLDSVFNDFDIRAVKTGMLSSDRVVWALTEFFGKLNLSSGKVKLIVDPVIMSKNGFRLLTDRGVSALKSKLLRFSYLVTPNLSEAQIISGMKIKDIRSLEKAAKVIYKFGCRNVLIKGGHFLGMEGLDRGMDVLFDGRKFTIFKSNVVRTGHTHGIGCVYSASITSNLALGKSLIESISLSKTYVVESLMLTRNIGKGISPVES
jgi:hydroxymethylpyrimidine/phosphomethylpyrimidine kinase